ncbi:MAG: glycosyltransferase, partial [Actinomycetota bacterium]
MGLDLGLVAHKVVRSDGQGRAMLELARAAAGAGHAVTVYCHTIDPGLLRADGIRWRRVAGSPGPDIVFGAAFAARATKALRRAGHELTCVLGSCAFGPVPFVNYAHFSWHAWRQAWNEVGGRPLHRRADAAVWERLERRCAGAAEAVMAVSGSLARDIEEVLCKPRRAHPAPSRILTVPNGIDLDEFRPATPDERQAARTRFGLSPDDTVVAFVGEFNTPRKGLRPLIEALARGRNPRERLLIAGDG